MNAPAIPVTDNVADLDCGATENEFPNGDDLAISRATDFYSLDELLTDRERKMRDRVRLWCDTEVAPAAADYWERAEFPVELAKGYGRLGIAGASIVGNGSMPSDEHHTEEADLRPAGERSGPGRHCCRPARRPAEYIPA
jgi:hypothetical protein